MGPGGLRVTLGHDALILCTGAMDRVIPIPCWTLPGVTTLGGAQIALNAQGVGIGTRPALVGTGPLLWLAALQYAKAGVKPALLLDTTGFRTKARASAGLLWNASTFLRGLGIVAHSARAACRSPKAPCRSASKARAASARCAGATPPAPSTPRPAMRWRSAGG